MNPDELRDRFHKLSRHRTIVEVRVHYGDESQVCAVPGGKRSRWVALVSTIYRVAPNWHRIELLGPRATKKDDPPIVDVVTRDIGEAVGFPPDVAAIANEAAQVTTPQMGQHLAGLGGLLQMVLAAIAASREGDRRNMESVTKVAIDTMRLYGSRLEGLERTLDKQINLAFALARKAGKLAAGGDGADDDDDSMSGTALEGLVEVVKDWYQDRKAAKANGHAAGDASPMP